MGVLDNFTTENDVKTFESAFYKAMECDYLTDDIKFNYATCLVQRNNAFDINKGIRLLKSLQESNPKIIDYLYFLAVGYAHIADYEMSLCYIDEILSQDSFHRQAFDLRSEIRNLLTVKAKTQQLENVKQGAMIAGGFLAIVGGIGAAAYALSGSSKKKKNNE